MTERGKAIEYCLTLAGAYEDYPFSDTNWCVIRHRGNKRVFAWIFRREGKIWINVKSHPQWRDFWRSAFESVIPGYHMNKEHWNSIILDGTIPDKDIKTMINESYELTKPKVRRKRTNKSVESGNY